MIPELKTLLAIARLGTFSAAGDRLGLTQAAVSGHIKRLEERLGQPLFDRTGRSATLNDAGRRTLEKAQAIVGMFDALTEPDDAETLGQLRIGAIASAQSTLLARALVPFRERFPGHHVHIVPGISLNLLDQMDMGELDIAVLIKPSYGLPREFIWQPLLQEPYALAVPAEVEGDDWISLLQEQPFIRYERGSFGGRQVDRFLRSHKLTVRDAIEIDDLPAMLALVAKGLGVALLPLTEASLPLPTSVRALPLTGQALFREIGMLRSARSDPATQFLVECLLRDPIVSKGAESRNKS